MLIYYYYLKIKEYRRKTGEEVDFKNMFFSLLKTLK